MMNSKNRTAHISIAFAITFLVILTLLHFLKQEIDPAWRMISEYEIGQYGWLMSVAFFCWGGSVLTVLATIWSDLNTRSGKIARGWWIVIGLALFGAGIWITNPIMDTTVTTENSLHTLCGVIVILTFPIAATITTRSLTHHPSWAAAQRRLRLGTLLVWLSQLAFFGSIIVSRLITPSAGRVGPEVYLGWPNRIMVLVYIIWIIIVAYQTISLKDEWTTPATEPTFGH